MRKKKTALRWKKEELLEMLISRTRENEELKAKLTSAEEKLKNQEIAVNNSSSLAEAALKLSGIFEAADAAAELYLKNIRSQAKQSERKNTSEENDSEQSEKNNT